MRQAKYNESLTVGFTNLTKTQKETLQQMFAYMQKCTAVGANRCIKFFENKLEACETKRKVE